MARICYICEKSTGRGHNVSHAQNKTKRRFMPNLRRVKIMEDSTPKTVRICSKCLKSGVNRRSKLLADVTPAKSSK